MSVGERSSLMPPGLTTGLRLSAVLCVCEVGGKLPTVFCFVHWITTLIIAMTTSAVYLTRLKAIDTEKIVY